MAPKRSSSSTPSTPSKKRKDAAGAQPSLASFLASPSKSKAEEAGKVGSGPTKEANGHDGQEDDDALFALKLAAREAGVSLSEMRRRFGLPSLPSAAPAAQTKPGDAVPPPKRQETKLPVHPLFQKPKPRVQEAARSRSAVSTPPPVEVRDAPIAGPSTPKKPSFDLHALDADINAIDLTEDVLRFDPAAVSTSGWPRSASGDPTTPYALLSHAFITISSTRSRLLITTVLTNVMRIIKIHDRSSLLPAIYLVSNHIAPNYDDVQLGIGGSLVNKAIKSVTGKSAKTLKILWDQTGDPGDVAFEAKKGVDPLVKPSPITVQKLFSTLHAIAALEGSGSVNTKLGHVTKLLVASRGEETRWLVRTFQSHLRIGAVKKTLSGALARCFSLIETGEEGPGKTPNEVMVGVEERQGILANPTKPKDRQDPRRLSVIGKFVKAEKVLR
jgi:DNA ligase-1